jgi:hypothetical protein
MVQKDLSQAQQHQQEKEHQQKARKNNFLTLQKNKIKPKICKDFGLWLLKVILPEDFFVRFSKSKHLADFEKPKIESSACRFMKPTST